MVTFVTSSWKERNDMAKKKKGFDISSFMDQESLDLLMKKSEKAVAPTEEEVEIIKSIDGQFEQIPVEKLVEFKGHTFAILDNEDMAALVESIRDQGIVLPLAVRPLEDGRYEIVSGHRRTRAAQILGLETVPCIIGDWDDETASILSVDTNLHRSEILPSEKARSYDLRIKAMRKKGLLGSDSDSKYTAEFAELIKSSRANVNRYRKLIKLSPDLLAMVDTKEISVNAGSTLADISKDDQACVVEALKESKHSITIENAEKIVNAARGGLTKEKVVSILDGEYAPKKKKSAGAPTGIKEKNLKAAYPPAVRSLAGSEREAFIRECIEAYIESHDSWKGIALR